MHVDLVPCSADDKDFAFLVTEETMRAYVETAFGAWEAEVQRQHLDESFDPATHSLIVVDAARAGLFVVEDRPAELFLAKIFLLPGFQRQGIGTALVRQLIERAHVEQKPVRLRVLAVNPAKTLYERLGFSVTKSTPEHHYMEYRP